MENPNTDGIYLDSLTNSDEDERDIEEAKKNKMTKADRAVISVLAGLNAAVFLFIGVFLYISGRREKKMAENAEALPPAVHYAPESVMEDLKPVLRGVKFPAGIDENFRRLYSVNEDVQGWLKIEDTCIDYPVLKGEDNLYYERRNYYGAHDDRGSVWLDFRNAVGGDAGALSKVTIIYGHHFSEHDLAFYEVEKYLDVEYYKTHPLIEFQTIYGNTYQWKVMGCMVCAADEKDDAGKVFYYWNPYVSEADFPAFRDEILRRSWFVNPDVDVEASDKLLCLSTCTYMLNTDGYHDIRCVLFGRLVREGESVEVDVTRAYSNENKRMPQLYYDQQGVINPYMTTPVFGE